MANKAKKAINLVKTDVLWKLRFLVFFEVILLFVVLAVRPVFANEVPSTDRYGIGKDNPLIFVEGTVDLLLPSFNDGGAMIHSSYEIFQISQDKKVVLLKRPRKLNGFWVMRQEDGLLYLSSVEDMTEYVYSDFSVRVQLEEMP